MKLEYLWPYPQKMDVADEFAAPQEISVSGPAASKRLLDDIAKLAGVRVASGESAYSIQSSIDPEVAQPQGYRLVMGAEGVELIGADPAGLAYGAETLLQVLVLCRSESRWPGLTITDWPAYRKRAFMVDMGRSTFPLVYLKRIVRILARLKMNQLHLHLFDDELCGIRFDGLPFGTGNPYAISIADLAELVDYAADYHVEIMPELEGWAHVGSLVYHQPELRGGAGMYDSGASFLIGEKMFDLMRELTRQVVDVLPENGVVHFGLDEALWFVDPAMKKGFSPEDLVRRYHDMLQDVAARAGKQMTMQVWADHGGRPIPEDIQENVIIEPWQYWRKFTDEIERSVEKYSSNPGLRWMMGAGQSLTQFRGAYYATRKWCELGLGHANCEGPDVTLWGWNDLDQKMISLFGGSYFAWNPQAPTELAAQKDDELFDKHTYPVMRWWQTRFPAGNPDGIVEDRGPVVLSGYYVWGKRDGQPVAPTATKSGASGWIWLGDKTSGETDSG